MKANRSWAGAAVLMLVLVPASAALAQPGSSDDVPAPGEASRGRGGPGFFQSMDGERGPFAGLDLTDAQRTQLSEIREKGQAEGTALRKQMMRLRNDMRGEMLQDRPDRRKIVRLAEQIGAVQTKLGVHRAEQHLTMLDVLTPEQRDEWLSRPHQGRRGGGMGHGGRGMGPGGRGARGFGGGGSRGL
jgi:Spy/CpxP family protein refolding chaperone